jgi:diaminopimelate epimerase
MVDLQFWKVDAAGNDFVMIDCRKAVFNGKLSNLAMHLADRRYGIGADGIIFIQSAPDADFFMAYYNADGSGPVMCGNGGRAALFFVKESGMYPKDHYNFRASDGLHQGKINADKIAVTITYSSEIRKIKLGQETAYLVDTGVPHLVRFVTDIEAVEIDSESPALRKEYDANVDYIQKAGDDLWKIRTYERGVEGETLACGTGATAAALTIHQLYQQPFPISLQARGGMLILDSEEDKLWLSGPSRKVFEGVISIEEK